MPLFSTIRAALASLPERFTPRVEIDAEPVGMLVVAKDELSDPLSSVGEELGNHWQEPVSEPLAVATDESQPLDAVVVESTETPVRPARAEHTREEKLGWREDETPVEEPRVAKRAEEVHEQNVRETRDPVIAPHEAPEPHAYVFSRIPRIFSMQLRLRAGMRLLNRIAEKQRMSTFIDNQLGLSSITGRTAKVTWEENDGPSRWRLQHGKDNWWSRRARLAAHPGEALNRPASEYPVAA